MIIKNRKLFMPLGMFSLVIGIFLLRFGPETFWSGFITGVLLGLSVVMNTVSIWKLRSE